MMKPDFELKSRPQSPLRAWGPPSLAVAGALVLLLAGFGTSFAVDATYRIGPGDDLRVDVSSRSDLSGEYRVSDGGMITIPKVGTVKAEGKTASELGGDLSRLLSLIDREIPRVTVTVMESSRQKIFVLGAVLLPGPYSFREPPTPWEAINQAGGAAQDAQLSAVEIIPGEATAGRTTMTIDLAALIRDGKVDTMEKLRPGDTVRVPRAQEGAAGGESMVYVFGAVGAQGGVPLAQAPNLVSALMRAGGPGAEADLGKVEVVRKDGGRLLHLRIDVQSYLKSSNPSGNIDLRPDDTVYLPLRRSRGGTFLAAFGLISPLIALATSIVALSRH
jgi:protein involved in polysaccharide export with SLBB domain